MFSFLSALVPKSRDVAEPAQPFEELPEAMFVPPARLINESAVAPEDPAPVAEASPPHEAAAPAAVEFRSVEDELREERLLLERQLAERREEQRLAEEPGPADAHPAGEQPVAEEQRRADEPVPAEDSVVGEQPAVAEHAIEAAPATEEQHVAEAQPPAEDVAAAEERRLAEQQARWRAEQAAEAKRLRAEREEAEQLEAERIVAEREAAERDEAERRAAARAFLGLGDEPPAPVPARFSWPATLLHHAVAMDYGIGVRRNLLSTIVELQDPNLASVLHDALYEESSEGLRPDVLGALRAAYHCEALRDTYERFTRIGNEREREIAREALFALAVPPS